jgi:UDP-N-acetylglucosamine 2-epimerase (non-hydrolysing)
MTEQFARGASLAPGVPRTASVPRVLALVGTRPEAIKMAPVIRALRNRAPRLETELVLTGQHRELVRDLLPVLGLQADHDLDLMRPGQTIHDVALGCMTELRRLMADRAPDLLLVQGDTASVFFGALTAFLERIPVGHVEAGLRSGDLGNPFPEEALRKMTSVITVLHFAPTEGARVHLLGEGVPVDQIIVTGNPVVDSLLDVAARNRPLNDGTLDTRLRTAQDRGSRVVLLTTHRRESLGAPLERMLMGIRAWVDETPDVELFFPVHPNPQVRAPVERILSGAPRVHLLDPLAYPDLVHLLEVSDLVLTDSGGIQEEAPTFGTPVLILREVTERPEGIHAGVAELVGTDPERIREAATRRLGAPRSARAELRARNPYGDGHAGVRIADAVEAFLLGPTRERKPQ